MDMAGKLYGTTIVEQMAGEVNIYAGVTLLVL